MSTMPSVSAADMLAQHGRYAIQLVISELVASVKRREKDAFTAWDAILRAIERKLDEDNDARVGNLTDPFADAPSLGSAYTQPIRSLRRHY